MSPSPALPPLRMPAAALLLVALLAPAPTSRPQAAPSLPPRDADGRPVAIVHARLVVTDGGPEREDWTVVLQEGRITALGPGDELAPPPDARVVDATGLHLLPGLCDFHVHVRDADELLLDLANGVTTVVNLHGTPAHLAWREEVERGALPGPTLVTAGPIVDGDPARSPDFVSVGDPALAEGIVLEQRAQGYDLLKVYDLLAPDVYRALTDAAHAAGVPVIGHVPKAVGLEGLLGRQDVIAHAEELYYTAFDYRSDEARIPAVAEALRAAGVALVPNTAVIAGMIAQATDVESVLRRDEVRYLDRATLAEWLPGRNGYVGRPAAWLARNRRMLPFLRLLTARLQAEGVTLLAGTDASIPGALPGFALHTELRNLLEAGLSPAEVLRTATANPGAWCTEHLGTEPPFGSLTAGARADLLLVQGDPLEDLSVLERPLAVVARGRWYGRAELDAELARIADRNAGAHAPLAALRRSLAAGRLDEAEGAVLGPDGPRVGAATLLALARHLELEGEAETELALLELASLAHPDAAALHLARSRAYERAGLAEDAREAADEALAAEPSPELRAEIEAWRRSSRLAEDGR